MSLNKHILSTNKIGTILCTDDRAVNKIDMVHAFLELLN